MKKNKLDLLDYEQSQYEYLLSCLNSFDINFDEKEDFIFHFDLLIDMLLDEIKSR